MEQKVKCQYSGVRKLDFQTAKNKEELPAVWKRCKRSGLFLGSEDPWRRK